MYKRQVLEEVAKEVEGKLDIVKVDVDQDGEIRRASCRERV